MRDSHREQVPDRSISWRGMGLGSGGPPLASRCGVSRRCGLRLAAAISGPEGFESGLAVSDGRGVPRRVALAACELGDWTRVGIGRSFHAAGGACTRGQPCAMRSGRSWHFGRSGFRESRAFHVEPGQPRCSGLEDAASACEHEAHNAERPQSPALHQAYGARNRPGGCPCGVEGAR